MRWKTTVVLVIATLAVGSYVALYELKQPPPEEQGALAKQVVQFPPEQVTSLLIEHAGTTVTLERRDGVWRLLGPSAGLAEASLVQRILTQLDPLEAERVLEPSKGKPLTPADFGLDPPRGTLTVMAGSRAVKLVFGAATAVGDRQYAKLADTPQVFVISSAFFDTLHQPVEAYRSHELLVFDTWKVNEIRVVSARASYTLTMLTKHAQGSADTQTAQGGRWQLTHPIRDEADRAAVSTILSKLRALRIERFLSDPSPPHNARPEWGFETPYAQITITLDQSPQPLDLLVGASTTDDPQQRYAKQANEPSVYAVAEQQIDDLLHDPQTFRARACFEFSPAQVTKLQHAWQGRSWTLEKRDGKWTAADTPMTVEASKVDAWLWKLRELQLTRFVDDDPRDLSRYGLALPPGTIQAWVTNQQEPVQLLVGDAISEGSKRYGRLSGRVSVVELPEGLDEFLKTTPEVFQASPPQPAATPPPSQ